MAWNSLNLFLNLIEVLCFENFGNYTFYIRSFYLRIFLYSLVILIDVDFKFNIFYRPPDYSSTIILVIIVLLIAGMFQNLFFPSNLLSDKVEYFHLLFFFYSLWAIANVHLRPIRSYSHPSSRFLHYLDNFLILNFNVHCYNDNRF